MTLPELTIFLFNFPFIFNVQFFITQYLCCFLSLHSITSNLSYILHNCPFFWKNYPTYLNLSTLLISWRPSFILWSLQWRIWLCFNRGRRHNHKISTFFKVICSSLIFGWFFGFSLVSIFSWIFKLIKNRSSKYIFITDLKYISNCF